MTLTPLITAAEGFPALEKLVASADTELLMSFRILDPQTRLRSDELTSEGLETWGDLLAHVARKGVRLRMVLADFDPVFTSTLHRLAWASASRFAEKANGNVGIICAPHGQEAGWFWRLAMRGQIGSRLAELRDEDPGDLTPLQRAALEGAVRLRPVTIHQKFAVADGARCVIGGLDINERRFDTPEHDRPAEETWQDVSMQVEDADFSAALRLHFAETWNAALDCGAPCLTGTAERLATDTRPQTAADLKLVRTFSAPCPGAVRLGPRSVAIDHEKATLSMIGEAERHIYVETQFLRHKPIADALVRAADRHPDLQLVMILPPAADRVLFDGDDGWDARHAHSLQWQALERLRKAFDDRLALISPARKSSSQDEVATLHGAQPIYVHSKVMLVDDRVGMVGSANLNGRSMRWDTEASVMFRRPDDVENLRIRLARAWLGPQAEGKDCTLAKVWRQAALTNAARAPEQRESFVLPYPLATARKFSRRFPLLPDEMF